MLTIWFNPYLFLPLSYFDCVQTGNVSLTELQSWTYSHEDSVSFSLYDIGKSHGRDFQVSFFLRSRKTDGLIFQLRTPKEEVYFSIYLNMGRIFISSRTNSSPLTAPVFLTTGEKQFLLVEVQQRHVIFEHASLRYGIGTIPDVSIKSGDQAYLGGLPENWDSNPWGGHYKGCIQDFRLDSMHLEVDTWNDQNGEDIYLSSEAENVKRGCISDNTCKVGKMYVMSIVTEVTFHFSCIEK